MLQRNLILRAVIIPLLCVTGSEAYGQFGAISGRVVDESGDPVSYANVYVSDTWCWDMTDQTGHYSIPFVPSGTCTLRVHAVGYLPTEKQHLTIAVGQVVKSDFVLKMEPPELAPRWRSTTEEPKYADVLSAERRDSLLEALARRAGFVGGEKIYRDDLPPVQWQKLEFHVRYTSENSGDSTLVRVYADATNVSENTMDICGVFSFLKGPRSLSFPGMTRTYSSPFIGCEVLRLEPGDTIADTVQFSYGRDEIETPPREVRLWCWFFRGPDGVPWEQTSFVDLGVLDIPVK